jgi:two-component system OmpR family response regulator
MVAQSAAAADAVRPTPPLKDANKRLLLVDDDVELREQMARYLADYEFEVFQAGDARGMDRRLESTSVDLVILDLMLPGEDGLSICRRLARGCELCIVMVSAAGEEVDRVLGLEFGADDYLPKPFGPRELLARVRAVLRRRGEEARPPSRGGAYHFGGFVYDPARRELRSPTGAMILLTAAESSLLGTLLMHPRAVLTREELAGPGHTATDPESRAIDLLVSRLRRKLQGHGGDALIRTQRGVGYAIDCPVSRN